MDFPVLVKRGGPISFVILYGYLRGSSHCDVELSAWSQLNTSSCLERTTRHLKGRKYITIWNGGASPITNVMGGGGGGGGGGAAHSMYARAEAFDSSKD